MNIWDIWECDREPEVAALRVLWVLELRSEWMFTNERRDVYFLLVTDLQARCVWGMFDASLQVQRALCRAI